MSDTILNMAREKLASMEKDAAKWERQMIDRAKKGLMKMPSAEDWSKMYNKAYTQNQVLNDTVLFNFLTKLGTNPNLKTISEKGKVLLNKLIENRNYMHSGFPNSTKVKPGVKLEQLSSKLQNGTLEDIVKARAEFLNTDNINYLKGLASTSKPMTKAFREAGGRNPAIRGMLGVSLKNNGKDIYDETPNIVHRKLVEDGQENLANKIYRSIKEKTGIPDGAKGPLFLSDDAFNAAAYTNSNNYAVANLDNIIEELKNRGINYQPNIGYPNPAYRKAYEETFLKETGVPLRRALDIFRHTPGSVSSFFRKNEIAIPDDLIKQLAPKRFHVYSVDPTKSSKLNQALNILDTESLPESKHKLKSVLKALKGHDYLKAMPLDDHAEGLSSLEHTLMNSDHLNPDIKQYLAKYPMDSVKPSTKHYIESETPAILKNHLSNLGVNSDNISFLRPFLSDINTIRAPQNIQQILSGIYS